MKQSQPFLFRAARELHDSPNREAVKRVVSTTLTGAPLEKKWSMVRGDEDSVPVTQEKAIEQRLLTRPRIYEGCSD